MTFRIILLAGASLATAVIAPAHAASPKTEPRMAVSFSDLDLAKADGAAALYARVRQAAKQVCGHTPGAQGLARRRITQRCIVKAVDGAVDQLDAPLVTALHDARDDRRGRDRRQALRAEAAR